MQLDEFFAAAETSSESHMCTLDCNNSCHMGQTSCPQAVIGIKKVLTWLANFSSAQSSQSDLSLSARIPGTSGKHPLSHFGHAACGILLARMSLIWL